MSETRPLEQPPAVPDPARPAVAVAGTGVGDRRAALSAAAADLGRPAADQRSTAASGSRPGDAPGDSARPRRRRADRRDQRAAHGFVAAAPAVALADPGARPDRAGVRAR